METGRGTAFEIITVLLDWFIVFSSRGEKIAFANSKSFSYVL